MDERALEELAYRMVNEWFDEKPQPQIAELMLRFYKRAAAPTVGESSPGGGQDLDALIVLMGEWYYKRMRTDLHARGPLDRDYAGKIWTSIASRAALSPSKARVGEDGGDATPGMDLREAVAMLDELAEMCAGYGVPIGMSKLTQKIRAILAAPPKGDPAAPSLLAEGREAVARDEIAKQLVEHAGFAMAMGGSKAEPIAWDTMPEPAREVWRTHADRILAIIKPSPQAGAQGDATGGGA